MNTMRDAERRRLLRVYLIEALGSVAGSLLTVGIFFFTTHEFGWSLLRNFSLSAGQGFVYIFAALSSHFLARRFGQRATLAGVLGIVAMLTLVAGARPTPLVVTVVLLMVGCVLTVAWPIVESLVTSGRVSPGELSRRVGVFNLVWAGVGAVVIAGHGIIIEKFARGVFLLPTLACIGAASIAWWGGISRRGSVVDPGTVAPAHPTPEPRLLRQRVMALWLSRISLPAMYIMTFSVAAMLPTLPVIAGYRPAAQTMIGSVWLVARWITFAVLGAMAFWHTRPRILLLASSSLLVALVMITIPARMVFGANASTGIDMTMLVIGQIIFGVATGMIYTGSLYFGMVLSDGSTEHGGYHEALIGLGMVLGPGTGVITQWLWPGSSVAAVSAIAGLLALTVLAGVVASVRFGARRR